MGPERQKTSLLKPIDMKKNKAKQVLSCDGGQLQGMLSKIKQLQAIEGVLKHQLDPALALHCRVANFRNGTLVIEVDSAAWATQIRYLTPDLLSVLRSEGGLHNLRAIKSYIHPEAEKAKTHKQSPRITLKGSQFLKSMLKTLKA